MLNISSNTYPNLCIYQSSLVWILLFMPLLHGESFTNTCFDSSLLILLSSIFVLPLLPIKKKSLYFHYSTILVDLDFIILTFTWDKQWWCFWLAVCIFFHVPSIGSLSHFSCYILLRFPCFLQRSRSILPGKMIMDFFMRCVHLFLYVPFFPPPQGKIVLLDIMLYA